MIEKEIERKGIKTIPLAFLDSKQDEYMIKKVTEYIHDRDQRLRERLARLLAVYIDIQMEKEIDKIFDGIDKDK